MLTGGYPIPEPVQRLLDGVRRTCRSSVTELGTFDTATGSPGVRGPLTQDSPGKIETALRLFAEPVDAEALLAAIRVGGAP